MKQERYRRQIVLKDFGLESQKKLAKTRVLVIGAGGLGIPVLTYLNAMGLGTIGIVDGDVVSMTNLHRQVLYTESDIGQSKVIAASKKLKAQNSATELVLYNTFINAENILEISSDYDIIVDASDNFPTRYLVNDACIILNKPFIYGALHGFEGQVSVFNYKEGPTYRCLFPNMPKENEVPNCNEHGVLGVLPGIIGNLQALETIKVITEIGEVLSGKLLIFDGLQQSYSKIKFKVRPENLTIKELQDFYGYTKLCANNATVDAKALEKLLTDKVQIIDVRTIEEYAHYHLPKSIHIPLHELEANSDTIDFSSPVYVLCQSGKRSAKAQQLLQKKHPKGSFFSVQGGLNQYLAICS